MKIHLIAVGGSVMHNMALALHEIGHQVSGSDDEIYDPAKSRLDQKGLLPENGWNPERITPDIDAVILGMHARIDNPELKRAQELDIPIYSFPEYVYEQSKGKTRVVIAGSHGKTSTTAMVAHVLRKQNLDFDFLIGAQLEGFDTMVRFSDAPIIIIEGDEYLASALNRKPKIHFYKPHISVITGIAWDHINVFPAFSDYTSAFIDFLHEMEDQAKVFYNGEDEHLPEIINQAPDSIEVDAFGTPESLTLDDELYLLSEDEKYPVSVFGAHNFRNIAAARKVCLALHISESDFWKAIQDFKGASKRMELLAANKGNRVYWDFAHAPSKVKAAVSAVRNQFPDHQICAVLELHTFSSLNKAFLKDYAGALDSMDDAMVFYSPHTVKMKRMEAIKPAELLEAFQLNRLQVFTDSNDLQEAVERLKPEKRIYLLMSSGKFGGWNVRHWAPDFLT